MNLFNYFLRLQYLVIIQLPLSEYEFKVENLFKDLQDGIMLSRTIRLLTSDASILSVCFSSDENQTFMCFMLILLQLNFLFFPFQKMSVKRDCKTAVLPFSILCRLGFHYLLEMGSILLQKILWMGTKSWNSLSYGRYLFTCRFLCISYFWESIVVWFILS